MSRRNRTTSHFHSRNSDSFSKTAYMYPNQRQLGTSFKKFGATKSTFFEERQRSLTNSVLDYQQNLNQSMQEPRADQKFIEGKHAQPHPTSKELHQRPISGGEGRHPLKRSVCAV